MERDKNEHIWIGMGWGVAGGIVCRPDDKNGLRNGKKPKIENFGPVYCACDL